MIGVILNPESTEGTLFVFALPILCYFSCLYTDLGFFVSILQYLLPAIVHISHQPKLVRGDGPIVSTYVIVRLEM